MKRLLVYMIIKILILLFPVKIHSDTHNFKVNTVQLHTDKLPAGTEFTVLQISDLHSKVIGKDNKKLIQSIKNLNADIIVITGDLIDRSTYNFNEILTLNKKISAFSTKIFFVSGNHEWGNPNYTYFLNGLRERNVTILNNQNTQITNEQILAGIDDASTGHEDMEKALSGLGKGHYTLMLSHTPTIIKKYKHIPADLILSGHTHGGQIRMPLIGAVVAPEQGFFPILDKGIFAIDENKYLYINSGLGTSLTPVRFLNKSQISFIRISNKR
ncbi:metallophosphoesterase [Virgibacillus oceani]